MAKISVGERANYFVGYIAGHLEIEEHVAAELEPAILNLLKVQDRETRHACAEAMTDEKAHSRCMNCCGGLVKL